MFQMMPCSGPPGAASAVDAARNLRVFDQRRRVVGLEAGVDDERAAAAPMFVFSEGIDAVNVDGRIRTRERDPEEVAERLGDELGVVDDDDQAEGGEGFRISDFGLRIERSGVFGALNCEDSGQRDARVAEAGV